MAETKRTGGGHGRNHGYQRPKDMKGTFKKLMGYVGKYKGSLMLVAICLLISSAAGVASSRYVTLLRQRQEAREEAASAAHAKSKERAKKEKEKD